MSRPVPRRFVPRYREWIVLWKGASERVTFPDYKTAPQARRAIFGDVYLRTPIEPVGTAYVRPAPKPPKYRASHARRVRP